MQGTSEVTGNLIESQGTEPFICEVPYVVGIVIAALAVGFVVGVLTIPILANIVRTQ